MLVGSTQAHACEEGHELITGRDKLGNSQTPTHVGAGVAGCLHLCSQSHTCHIIALSDHSYLLWLFVIVLLILSAYFDHTIVYLLRVYSCISQIWKTFLFVCFPTFCLLPSKWPIKSRKFQSNTSPPSLLKIYHLFQTFWSHGTVQLTFLFWKS